MVSLWTLSRLAGPTAAAFVLRGRHFSPREAERLSAVLQRNVRGEFEPLSRDDKQRALFICWLKDHGRPTDHPADPPVDEAEPAAERILAGATS